MDNNQTEINQTETGTNQYLITHLGKADRIFSFLIDERKTIEIHCDPVGEEREFGSIYVGKIKNIAKNLNAAFVETKPGMVCYLPLEEIKNPIYTKKGSSKNPQAGDELLVQISKEAIKTKAPSVTTNLVLHGKYALLTTGKRTNAVSSKIYSPEKERLLSLLKDQTEPEYGWLLRTNAAGISEETLNEECSRLQNEYEKIRSIAPHRPFGTCLYRQPPAYLARIANLYRKDLREIVIEDQKLYEEVTAWMAEHQKEDLKLLRRYEDPLLSMDKLYSLKKQLSEALSEKVWLKSGGYLVIQPTETLTVIDVNTGKYEGGKKKEAAFLKINLEAAQEIARQLRLRNISGIIIADFINMQQKQSNETLLHELEKILRKDPVPCILADMTKLSLVEMTRKKTEAPLAEIVSSIHENIKKF